MNFLRTLKKTAILVTLVRCESVRELTRFQPDLDGSFMDMYNTNVNHTLKYW